MELAKRKSLTNQGREPVAKGPMQALVAEDMHYIRAADGLEELYLLKSDPEEQFDVAGESFAPETLERFRSRLKAMLPQR
jgi:hypothetical protein